MGDEYPCPHCGAMNRERTDYLRITCRVCGGQYEARHLVSTSSIAELAKQVSEAEWDSKEQALQKSIIEHQRVISKLESRFEEQGTYNQRLIWHLIDALEIVRLVAEAPIEIAEFGTVNKTKMRVLCLRSDVRRVQEKAAAVVASGESEERLKRAAGLLEIVRKVADADNSDHSVCYQLCSYDMHWTDDDHQVMTHNTPCVVEQARALLGDRAEGEPQS